MTDRALQLAEEAKRLAESMAKRDPAFRDRPRLKLHEAIDSLAALSQGAPEGRAVASQAGSVAERKPLTEEGLRIVFDEVAPKDSTNLRIHENGGHVAPMDLIGASGHWHEFQRSARAVERVHGIGATQPAPSRDSLIPPSSNSGAEGQQAAPASDWRDAYEGAREDLLDWKRRALRAEADLSAEQETTRQLNRALREEVDGPTFMGEPVIRQQAARSEAPAGFYLVAVKGFDKLMEALIRAADKGYMPDAMAEEWAAFDWREVPASPPSERSEAPAGWKLPIEEVTAAHPLKCLIVLPALRQSDGDWWQGSGGPFLGWDRPLAWMEDTPENRAALAAPLPQRSQQSPSPCCRNFTPTECRNESYQRTHPD